MQFAVWNTGALQVRPTDEKRAELTAPLLIKLAILPSKSFFHVFF